MSAAGITLTVKDVLGIPSPGVTLEFVPGCVNILTGPNGLGKTSVALALARACGDEDVELEVHDGAGVGLVEARWPADGDGDERGAKFVVPASGRVRAAGEALPLTAQSTKALVALITGDNAVTAPARAKARLKAFLELVRPELDETAVSILAEHDDEMSLWLRELKDTGQVRDVLTASQLLKKELERRKRELANASSGLEGQAQAHMDHGRRLVESLRQVYGMDTVPVASPEVRAESQEATLAALKKLSAVEEGARLRAEKEALLAEIRESGVPRPDVAAAEAWVKEQTEEVLSFKSRFDAAGLEAKAIEEQLSELRAKLREKEEEIRRLKENGQSAERRRHQAVEEMAEVKRRAAEWDAQRAMLDKLVEGPTADDVKAAAEEATEARRQEDVARIACEIAECQAEADKASEKAKRDRDRAGQYDAWAKDSHKRLADILRTRGAGRWGLVDGELGYRLEADGELAPVDTRLSPGQRMKAAFELASATWKGVVYVDPAFYNPGGLDDAGRAWVAEYAREHREVLVVTESATSGPLRVEHVGGAR